jgi:two-component system, chemotaxis family, response regulator Rcp1
VVKSRLEILLVEDNPADVRLISDAFEEIHANHHLNVAPDGEDALNFLFRRGNYINAPRVDLVLLDLNLPIMTGHAVLRAIRANPDTTLVPVVILSSSNARKDVQQAYESHANGYVKKPMDLDGIYKAVDSLKTFWLEVAELPSSTPCPHYRTSTLIHRE